MSDAQPQSRYPLNKLTLNQLFFRIVLIGIGALIVVSIILMQQERRQALRRWQLDTISHSAAVMSSYYSILVTKLILGQTADVESVLEQTQKSERLRSVRIVPQAEVATAILETCNIDYSKAFFYQAPTCLETTADTIRVYHELRSAGHSLGYLVKEIPLPQLPLFQSTAVGPYMLIVVLCFLGVNMIVLFYFRRYVMRPTKQMIEALNRHQSLDSTPSDYRCQELHMLASSLGTALRKIAEYQETAKRLEYDAKIGQLTSQVAHDIRSPLAALDVVTTTLAELPEEKRVLVRRATARIRDIANSLIEQSSATHQRTASVEAAEETVSVELLSSLIDPLMTEKRLQFRARQEVEIQAELSEAAYGLFARVQPTEFKRVLSNVVNNAVEVIKHRGTVLVRLRLCEGMVFIEVHDTGKGIPPETLVKLTRRGATFGKVGGSGFGLYHARERVEAWGGTLTISSEVGKGTTVILRLPAAAPATWFVPSLTLRDGMTLVVLDDDQSHYCPV